MNKRLKPLPKFASGAAERAFWEKNDSTGYLDWKKAAANARDVPYQSLIKVWLQEKLQGS
jgi:hypothetical protein